MDSYRCSVCSIDFNLIESLVEHSEAIHDRVQTTGSISCVRCELDFDSIDDLVEHHHAIHEEVAGDEDEEVTSKENDITKGSIEVIDVEVPNSDVNITANHKHDGPNEITIINDHEEAIVVDGEHEENSNAEIEQVKSKSRSQSSVTQPSSARKRKVPTRLRDSVLEPLPKRQTHSTQAFTPQHPVSENNDLEIDISSVSSLKLTTTRNTHQQAEIMSYLQKVNEKLDCIIRHFNVPFTSLFDEMKLNPLTNLIGKNSAPKRTTTTQKPLRYESFSAPRNISERTTRNGNESISYISVEQPPMQEITQYVISDELLEITYLKSRNRGNFAKNLVYAAFPLEERLGRNCYGRRGGSLCGPKEALEAAKLDAVREAVFKKFPVTTDEDDETVWKRECVIAIDTALRSEMRTRILSMQSPKSNNDDLRHTLMNMPM